MQYVYAKPCVHRFNYSGHSRREVPRQGWTSRLIREYNDDSSHLTYINKYSQCCSTHCLGFVSFSTHTILRTTASGITPPKKMLLMPRWPSYYRMCSTDVYCSKQAASGSTKNHHPSFLRFWLGRKLSMQPKFVAAQKMLKQKPSKHS